MDLIDVTINTPDIRIRSLLYANIIRDVICNVNLFSVYYSTDYELSCSTANVNSIIRHRVFLLKHHALFVHCFASITLIRRVCVKVVHALCAYALHESILRR